MKRKLGLVGVFIISQCFLYLRLYYLLKDSEVMQIRKKKKTITLAYIRRMIRNAVSWSAVDGGECHFWTTENYKGARLVKRKKGERIGDYPYYSKSEKALEVIAEKIYNRVKSGR